MADRGDSERLEYGIDQMEYAIDELVRQLEVMTNIIADLCANPSQSVAVEISNARMLIAEYKSEDEL